MGTILAEPIMMHAVVVTGRIVAETEELSVSKPIESFWASRIGTLWMEPVIDGKRFCDDSLSGLHGVLLK
jgi:hypothetical protein